MMNLKHLEFFGEVARCGSINKASQKLYTSQPYISYVIHDLEEEVGYPLFIRTQRGVVLTDKGKVFLKHTQIVMQEIEELKDLSFKRQKNVDTLSISITKFSHPMDSFIHLCRNRQQLNYFEYRLNEGSMQEVVKEVASGVANIGVIHYGSHIHDETMSLIDKSNLEFQSLGHFSPHIIISKNHELFQQNKEVTLSSLQGYGLVRFTGENEDFLFDLVSDEMTPPLRESPRIAHVYGRAASLHLISSSNFYTIGIQEFSTQNSMYQILSIPINTCKRELIFGIITQKNKSLTDSAKEFINHLSRNFKSMKA